MFVRECNTKEEINDFLKLGYSKEIKQLIYDKHILSKGFKIKGFVAYSSDGSILGRCAVTTYSGDGNAYIGMFECVDRTKVCKELLSKAEDYAKICGKTKLVGPVDASFWIKYRFKTTSENRDYTNTYTGEPYNKEYYTKLWEDCGFKVSERYTSNMYRQVVESDKSEKSELRLRQMKEKGYKFRNCSFKTFNKDLKNVYELMINLYSTFPTFKHIEYKEFKKLFWYLRYVLNYSMTWIVEKDNKAVAFFICVPNYENIKGLGDFFKVRKNPKEYVMLYMGVEKSHLGLGSALACLTKEELYKNGCKSIGALIHGSKPTGNYYKNLIVGKTEYVLFEKEINT